MSDIAIDLFVEDHAHEAFLTALIRRLATEKNRQLALQVRSARGGHGRVLSALDDYRKRIEKAVIPTPDLFVVAIDANCKPLKEARDDIEKSIKGPLHGKTVIACPDPHIERWFMADPVSFQGVVGRLPNVPKKKCGRDMYKTLLSRTIRAAGHIPTLGGLEFADELVAAMDLYEAGKNDRSLGQFVDDMRRRFQQSGG